MLTNKKIGVLIILITFFLTSCGTTNVEKSDKDIKIQKTTEIKNSIDGKKGKSIGGESLEKKQVTKSVSESGLNFNK